MLSAMALNVVDCQEFDIRFAASSWTLAHEWTTPVMNQGFHSDLLSGSNRSGSLKHRVDLPGGYSMFLRPVICVVAALIGTVLVPLSRSVELVPTIHAMAKLLHPRESTTSSYLSNKPPKAALARV
jgi:hypothetical protein